MNSPRVSVIVVNYNRRSRLQRALESLRAQTTTVEIVVVDNGSHESIADLATIRNPRNLGFARAVNQGIAAARGEFIALLNNDAIACPHWLEAMLEAADGRPDVGMVASKILVMSDPRIIDKVGHLIYPDGQNRGRGSGEIDHGQFDRMDEVLWPDGCAALYRRSMLREIGGFEEAFFAYGEDAELGMRARIAGWKCLYTPRAVVWHERAATLGLASVRRVSLIERNRVLLAVRHFPLRLLWLNPFYYAARLASGALASARGQGEAGLFPGLGGKLRLTFALLRGDIQSCFLIPNMIWRRLTSTAPRRLNSAEVAAMIQDNRISLRALSTEVAYGEVARG